ncbi:hypothetical protein BMT55_06210 [Listeria newyorkensis]|uniref:DUF5105 domain-containing protein n=1 Tax=Listeria newyorkensis TaxID=1497681 RepID=A0ABX4XN02_9LIST|nr:MULTISPECIES: DUF5105 domain-containing protein [Listeria]KGL39462.1 hypothetical protein EP56_12925 [Listeriaceae bacterium FSL A5-0209]KGL46494.1 hypothetical protein EP58_01615 [Listeria newyorkensis]PNP93017.1 hypothetical protein BMT55_06210 [Listeria newyorkensis]RQW67010.1 DUF5105 domain-containing protein [Listeria sp. SHR_NRA_18]WAO21641.1 DUF5105 domain-containing protein [Listeria newyorkensis]
MKKKLTLMFVVVLTAVITLSACGSNNAVEPKAAADIAVNTIIFNKDVEKYKDTFGKSATALQINNKETFTKRFAANLKITDGSMNEEIGDLYDAYTKRAKEVTKYTSKVTNDDKKKPTVEISVNGLDMASMQAERLAAFKAKVKADPSIEKDKKKSAKAVIDGYKTTIPKAKASKKAVQVKLNLEANEDQWKIKDDEDFANNLYRAFFTGTAQ